jgi:hypothetical protein
MTRKAGAAPANVHATVELSDVAVARFSSLALKVNVYSGESLDAQGLRAQWLGEPGGEPVRANFSGEWSATWSADLYVASAPCTAGPCTLNLELAPEGQWNSELSFAMEYDVVALLELQGNYYPQLDSALELSLEAQP